MTSGVIFFDISAEDLGGPTHCRLLVSVREDIESRELVVIQEWWPDSGRVTDVDDTVLPKRWIVERTLAWLNRCRRLAKDWENLNRKALAFLRLASIRLMLRKLCNPV